MIGYRSIVSRLLPPTPPVLLPEVMAELELHGADAMRALLVASTDGQSGTGRATTFRIGNVVPKRGEIQDWLKWKAAIDAYWVRVAAIAAVLAALFSLIAVFK